MIEFKRLTNDDYNEVIDVCKGIWGGNDYIPKIYNQWINQEKGCFLGLKYNNRLVGLAKYSVLPDNQGWLEGLRVHQDYRGMNFANLLSDKLFELAKKDIINKVTTSVAMCTHKNTTASIKMMTKRGFHLEQSCLMAFKEIDSIASLSISKEDFDAKPWNVSYEELISLDYFKNFNNRIMFGYTFYNLCEEVFEDLVKANSLIDVNGYKAIVKFKGNRSSLMCMDESIESLNTLANYCLTTYNTPEVAIAITNPSKELVDKLNSNNFEHMDSYEGDCLYYLYTI